MSSKTAHEHHQPPSVMGRFLQRLQSGGGGGKKTEVSTNWNGNVKVAAEKPRRSRSPFGSLVHRLSIAGRRQRHNRHPAGKTCKEQQPQPLENRVAVSEENLLSKSLATELEQLALTKESTLDSTSCSAAGSPTAPLNQGLSHYYSQDSFMIEKESEPRRAPSYLRISCAISGYTNYRRPFHSSGGSALPLISTPARSAGGRSFVERRLEKFEDKTTAPPPPASPNTTAELRGQQQTTASVKRLVEAFQNCSTAENGGIRLDDSPMENGGQELESSTMENGEKEQDIFLVNGHENGATTVANGVNFLEKAKQEKERLLNCCEEAEEWLLLPELTTEAAELLHLAVGKTRLLVGKKLRTFEQLASLHLLPEDEENGPKVTLDDLEAYWQLVGMEMRDVNACFDELNRARDNDWQPQPKIEQNRETPAAKKRRPRETNSPKSDTSSSSSRSPASAEKDQQRRRQLREAKLRARQRLEQQRTADGLDDDAVEIFAK